MGHNELTLRMAEAITQLLAFAEPELEQRQTGGNDEEFAELEQVVDNANSVLALYEVDAEHREIDAVCYARRDDARFDDILPARGLTLIGRFVPTDMLDFEGQPRYAVARDGFAILDHDGNPVKSYSGFLPGNDGMIGEPYAEEPGPEPMKDWSVPLLITAAVIVFVIMAVRGFAFWLGFSP